MNFKNYSTLGSSYLLPAYGKSGVRARFQISAAKIFCQSREGVAEGRGKGDSPVGEPPRPRSDSPFFGGIGGRISQSEMRRQKRCCPCPNPPVRGQGTP